MSDRAVSEEEFDAFIKGYGKPLESSVHRMYEPVVVSYNDFSNDKRWPESIVAYKSEMYDEDGQSFKPHRWEKHYIKTQQPIVDDGKRDGDTPLLDTNGVALQAGDRVKVLWGGVVDQNGARVNYRTDVICIRDKGTRHEHWSFESCHNYARGFEMTKLLPI